MHCECSQHVQIHVELMGELLMPRRAAKCDGSAWRRAMELQLHSRVALQWSSECEMYLRRAS
eukprot:13197418-Alexandrium_andersonii.AAC.1